MVTVTFRVCLSSSVEPIWKIPHSPSEDYLPCDAKSSQADNQRYPSCLAKIPPSSSRVFQKLPTYVHPADLQLPLVSLSFPLHFHLFTLWVLLCSLDTLLCLQDTTVSSFTTVGDTKASRVLLRSGQTECSGWQDGSVSKGDLLPIQTTQVLSQEPTK